MHKFLKEWKFTASPENFYRRKTDFSNGPYVDVVHCVDSVGTILRYMPPLVCRSSEQPVAVERSIYCNMQTYRIKGVRLFNIVKEVLLF